MTTGLRVSRASWESFAADAITPASIMSIRSYGLTMILAPMPLICICNMLFGPPGWKFDYFMLFSSLFSDWNPR
jgi:hypothetical protein